MQDGTGSVYSELGEKERCYKGYNFVNKTKSRKHSIPPPSLTLPYAYIKYWKEIF